MKNRISLLVFTALMFSMSVSAQFTQQGSKLASGTGQGTSVSLSTNGNVMAVGDGTSIGVGRTLIYTRSVRLQLHQMVSLGLREQAVSQSVSSRYRSLVACGT